MNVNIDKILPNPEQPRKVFDAAALEELAASIREHGIIQPLVVEPEREGFYILVDGERRWRAGRLAGLASLPVHIQDVLPLPSNEMRLARAMVANLQRADLTPIEEAKGYQAMQQRFGISCDRIAQMMGVCRARVDHRLLLLQLDEPIQELIAQGNLVRDRRLAEALLEIPDAEARVELARRVAGKGITITAAVKACKQVAASLTPMAAQKKLEMPSVDLAREKAVTTAKRLPSPQWDALRQLGKLPAWELVQRAAERMCTNCDLRSVASRDVCDTCPGVELLRWMMEEAK